MDNVHKFKKVAEKIVSKVQDKILKNGAYENAGQKEILLFRDKLNAYNLNYQEQCNVMDYINNLVDNLNYN